MKNYTNACLVSTAGYRIELIIIKVIIMFKKILNLFGSGEEEKTTLPTTPSQSFSNSHHEEEDIEENEEDTDRFFDSEYIDHPHYRYNPGGPAAPLDPETLHGLHYTVEEFEAEVEAVIARDIREAEADNGKSLRKAEIDNIRHNVYDHVYLHWTNASQDDRLNWSIRHSEKISGVAVFGFQKTDENNPLLEPIHGISLEDYAAACAKAASMQFEDILTALGIEKPVWDEVSTLWNKRMAEDSSFTVINLYTQYMGEADRNPKFSNIAQTEISAEGKTNIEKLKNDYYFYLELNGARQAAYEYGIDGAQWIDDNYGIPLIEFQQVAMEHMKTRNMNFNSEQVLKDDEYQQAKQAEYAKKFAAEQGGNVADDIEF